MPHDPVPIVMSGPPRSGTTLVSASFDGHSEINWLPDEGFFFEHIFNAGVEFEEMLSSVGKLGINNLIEGIQDRNIMPPMHQELSDFPSLEFSWDHAEFKSALDEGEKRSFGEFWSMLLNAYLEGLKQNRRKYVCLKAADFGRSVFGAFQHFPQAKCIVVVRNPIDCLNSLKQYRQKFDRKKLSWPTLCESLIQMQQLAKWVAEHHAHDRIKIVKYEDFLGSKFSIMEGLSCWLGIKFEQSMMNPTMFGSDWTTNSSFIHGKSGSSSRVKRKYVLDEREVEFISKHSKLFLDTFEYI